MDVRNSYRLSAEPDGEQVLHGRPSAYLHVPESGYPCHRDLQVWIPGVRRICGMEVADLQFCIYESALGCRYRRVQQGSEEFHGYGVR